MALMTTREVIERYGNASQRAGLVEQSADAGMPFSAYLDSQYDPEKDGELGADDDRRSGFEVVLDELEMTTECNPAAGIWPTRTEDVIGRSGERVSTQRDVSERLSEYGVSPADRGRGTQSRKTCALGTRRHVPGCP